MPAPTSLQARRRLIGAAALTLLPALSMAQAWPAKPIRLVVPFAAGTAPDVLGRLVAPVLAESMSANVVVENVPSFAAWTLYPAWCSAMGALGYALAPMVLDSADHGVPQQRRRLFVVATRSRHPVELKLPQRPHRPAAAVRGTGCGDPAQQRPVRSRN